MYELRVRFASYATGERLLRNLEGAFFRAVDRMRGEPGLWLRFRPLKIGVKECVAFGDPPTHEGTLTFEILDVAGASPVQAETIKRHVVAAFLDYFALWVGEPEVVPVSSEDPLSPDGGSSSSPPEDQRGTLAVTWAGLALLGLCLWRCGKRRDSDEPIETAPG